MVRGSSASCLKQFFQFRYVRKRTDVLRCYSRELSCLPRWSAPTIYTHSQTSYHQKYLSIAKFLATSSLTKYGLNDLPPRIKSKRSSSIPRKAKLRRAGISLSKKRAGNPSAAAVARHAERHVRAGRTGRENLVTNKVSTRRALGENRIRESLKDSMSKEEEWESLSGRKTTMKKLNRNTRINFSVSATNKRPVAQLQHKMFSRLRATAARPKFTQSKRQIFVRSKGEHSMPKVFGGKFDNITRWKKIDRPPIFEKHGDSRQELAKFKEIDEKMRIKRVMRLDPRDNTRKRIDECHEPQAKTGSSKMQSVEKNVSANALFRAIQPSEELLEYIEKHMLGRRRLIEWRRAGYDVKLKAPLDDLPYGNKNERQPITDNVFKNKLKFIAAAKKAMSLPAVVLPEVAFAGRSNVGKSSLINALTRQWGVARTSEKPGLTQTINFFNLGSRLCLVDLPGYGFAFAKEEIKEAWEDFVKDFVVTRKGLKRVCVLLDAKWGLKPRDEELLSLMESARTKYQIVLTKTDALSPLDLARRTTQVQEALKNRKSLVHPVMMVSSKTGGGIPAFRTSLAKLAA